MLINAINAQKNLVNKKKNCLYLIGFIAVNVETEWIEM